MVGLYSLLDSMAFGQGSLVRLNLSTPCPYRRLLTHRRIELLVIPLPRLPTVLSDRTHRLSYSRRNGKSIQQSVNRRRTHGR